MYKLIIIKLKDIKLLKNLEKRFFFFYFATKIKY